MNSVWRSVVIEMSRSWLCVRGENFKRYSETQPASIHQLTALGICGHKFIDVFMLWIQEQVFAPLLSIYSTSSVGFWKAKLLSQSCVDANKSVNLPSASILAKVSETKFKLNKSYCASVCGSIIRRTCKVRFKLAFWSNDRKENEIRKVDFLVSFDFFAFSIGNLFSLHSFVAVECMLKWNFASCETHFFTLDNLLYFVGFNVRAADLRT